MTAVARHQILILPEDYLAAELLSPVKHEYLGGIVHAMAGGKNGHNQIATNVLVGLGMSLRGKKCRPFNSDTKVRVRMPNQIRFYYPDAQVVCDPNPDGDSFNDRPVVIVEVISESTRRTDEGEKLDAYFTIPSLETYLIVESALALVVAYHRTDTGFKREIHTGLESSVQLDCIGVNLPLAEIYERLEFPPLELVE